MRYDDIIAIDPDVDKSGVAFLKPASKDLKVCNLSYPELMDYLLQKKVECAGERLVVVVEAGWIERGNWHLYYADNARIASAKGNSTGRNHETGRKIVEMSNHYGLETVEHIPLRKCWKGRDRKITQAELSCITGLNVRTNQDARDAALLAWDYSGLPIKI